LYTKFFEAEKKTQLYCQCGNLTETKILKMGLKIINYGICDYCNTINFFNEVYEFYQGKYHQILKTIQPSEIKADFEYYLDSTITEKDVQFYSSTFDTIIAKIQKIEEEKHLQKINPLNNDS
jgi:hypothetical protein